MKYLNRNPLGNASQLLKVLSRVNEGEYCQKQHPNPFRHYSKHLKGRDQELTPNPNLHTRRTLHREEREEKTDRERSCAGERKSRR